MPLVANTVDEEDHEEDSKNDKDDDEDNDNDSNGNDDDDVDAHHRSNEAPGTDVVESVPIVIPDVGDDALVYIPP